MNNPINKARERIDDGINTGRTLAAHVFDLARRNPFFTIAALAIVAYLVLYTAPSLYNKLRQRSEDRTIEKLEKSADKEITGATREKIAAGELDAERTAEDQNRHNNLEPSRQRANVTLAEASRRRKEIEDRYAKIRTTSQPDLDTDTLRRRNCSDFAELYPGQSLAGCQ